MAPDKVRLSLAPLMLHKPAQGSCEVIFKFVKSAKSSFNLFYSALTDRKRQLPNLATGP
jgi:hypothetical protein